MGDSPAGEFRRRLPFYAAGAILFAVLMTYALTRAFAWDEGFHLLAAQLILAGKRPYLDFCFPQTPLNAYLTAGWMHVFGSTWRAVHVLETLCTAGAAFVTAEYAAARFPVREWRLAGALAAAVAVGWNSQVVLFGTIGQSYGLCLLLAIAAYRAAVVAVERRGFAWAAASGLLAGAAAGSSMLTAPAGPVILVWMAVCNRAGNRWAKLVAFLAGGAVSWLPMVWLYRQGPVQTLFNLFHYQLRYRHHWEGALRQDISTLTSWIDSAQGMSLAILAIAGLWYAARRSHWTCAQRSEIYLSAAIALALMAELATAHPTFNRYFLVVVPFVAIPAIAGLYAVAMQAAQPIRPIAAAGFLIVVLGLGLGKAIWEDSDSYQWSDVEKIAQKVDQVTPRQGVIWADELIYFLNRRPIPDGMEFAYAHSIEKMAPAEAAKLHILTAPELQSRARAGAYATVAACYDSDNTDAVKASDLYRQKETIKDCTVFWDFGVR